jgi:hypothetical protein
VDITRHFTMGITVQVLGVMEFHERQIEPPSSWEEFEELCLTLFRRIWKDPTAQKNGRRGQPQAGTDISGYDAGDHGSPRGVQCKGKDRLYGAAVTAAELREEVEKAKAFKPKLSHWVLATTARKDNAIEELARIITEDHRASGTSGSRCSAGKTCGH